MTKNTSKFWLGLFLGALGGAWVARELLEPSRMPNARLWQRILSDKSGQVESGVLMARVQQRYEELMARRPTFSNWIFNFHVVRGILPGLALYLAFRDQGMSQEKALNEVNWILETWFNQTLPLNLRVNHLMKHVPQNFDIFRRLVLLVTDRFFPAPGWNYEIVEDSEAGLAITMHRCFYIDVLKYYQATELTPVFCKMDDYLMKAMPPSIRWGRTQTIGMDADCCDFHWDYVPAERIEAL